MIKNVAISLLVILLSSCSYTPATATRGEIVTQECIIAVVDPATGTCLDAIKANKENWDINIPICRKKFEIINRYDEEKKQWWEIF